MSSKPFSVLSSICHDNTFNRPVSRKSKDLIKNLKCVSFFKNNFFLYRCRFLRSGSFETTAYRYRSQRTSPPPLQSSKVLALKHFTLSSLKKIKLDFLNWRTNFYKIKNFNNFNFFNTRILTPSSVAEDKR